MKKILKSKGFKITFCLAIIAILVLLCFIFKTNENMISRVTRVLWAKYYNIECINEECKYVAAYKGDKKGKSTVKIINSKGKTVVKYTINATDELSKKPVAATDKYAILALKDNKAYTHGYVVVNSNGKEVLKEEKVTLFTITDKYFYGKDDELYTIYDYNGNVIYKDVKELNFYNSNKIITFVNDGLTIIDETSERILNGYEIVKEVKDGNDTLYLIVKDKDNVYYYFNVTTNEIVGDGFNSYSVMSDNKLLVNKKINNEIKKYLLNIFGKEEKEISSKSEAIKEITSKVKEGYEVSEDSIFSTNQEGVLVVNTNENSFGTYNLKTGDFSELFRFSGETRKISIYNLYEDLETVKLEVGCTLDFCTEETVAVYNPYDNSISFRISNSEKEVKRYREYEDGIKVVTYTDKTFALIDQDGKEVLTSLNNIVVLGKKIIVNDDASKSNVILYSAKENKVLNDDNTLAILDEKSNYSIYKFYDEESLYLYDNNGELLKKIPIAESSITIGDKYISYLSKNKLNIYSLINDRTINIDFNDGESNSDGNGTIIAPNKGTVIISNKEDKVIRVLNYNKKQVKKIKNSTVKTVSFDEKNNNLFLITKSGKNYNLYIIK